MNADSPLAHTNSPVQRGYEADAVRYTFNLERFSTRTATIQAHLFDHHANRTLATFNGIDSLIHPLHLSHPQPLSKDSEALTRPDTNIIDLIDRTNSKGANAHFFNQSTSVEILKALGYPDADSTNTAIKGPFQRIEFPSNPDQSDHFARVSDVWGRTRFQIDSRDHARSLIEHGAMSDYDANHLDRHLHKLGICLEKGRLLRPDLYDHYYRTGFQKKGEQLTQIARARLQAYQMISQSEDAGIQVAFSRTWHEAVITTPDATLTLKDGDAYSLLKQTGALSREARIDFQDAAVAIVSAYAPDPSDHPETTMTN